MKQATATEFATDDDSAGSVPEKRPREALDAGATGVIYGRSIRPSELAESSGVVERLEDMLGRYLSGREELS